MVRNRDEDDVLYCVKGGEHVGLVGKNRTGKSTLLSILAGVDFAESGETSQRLTITEIGHP